jgi:fucose permease
MSPDQRTKLIQGIVFGVFFQYLGYFIKDLATKRTPPYFGGYIGIVMGVIIFAWGCSHLVAAKRLPTWTNAIGFLSVLGLAILWFWPPGTQEPARSTTS